MAVQSTDIFLDQYVDFWRTDTWYAGRDAQSTVPVDLTGSMARLMIRAKPTDASPVLSISSTPSASGVLLMGGSTGQIEINITKTATASLASGTYRYDLFVDFPGGYTLAFMSGYVFVRATNTH